MCERGGKGGRVSGHDAFAHIFTALLKLKRWIASRWHPPSPSTGARGGDGQTVASCPSPTCLSRARIIDVTQLPRAVAPGPRPGRVARALGRGRGHPAAPQAGGLNVISGKRIDAAKQKRAEPGPRSTADLSQPARHRAPSGWRRPVGRLPVAVMTAAGFPAAFARLPPPLTAGSRFVAALCLALLCVLALPAAAQAQTTVWSATLSVQDLGSGVLGCSNAVASKNCSQSSILSDDDFTYDGTDHEVSYLQLRTNGNLEFLMEDPPYADGFADLTLVLGTAEFRVADAATTSQSLGRTRWDSTTLSWSAGDSIAVSLVEPAVPTPPTFASGSVTANGWGILLVFSEDIDRTAAGRPPASAFRIALDGGTPFEPNAVTAPGTTAETELRLASGTRIRMGQTVTVTYTDPTPGDDPAAIQDLDGTDAATFTDQPVTNNSTYAPLTVPGPPTGLTATTNGATRIDLAWTAPTDNGGAAITGYRIEVSDAGSSWSDLVADTGSTTTTGNHVGLSPGTTRHYRVSAINSEGAGNPSNEDSATTVSAPSPPRNVITTAGNSQATVIWNESMNNGGAPLDCYQLRRKKTADTDYGNWETCLSVGGVQYSVTVPSLTNGTEYSFQVRARNSAGLYSMESAAATVTPRTVPGRPQNMTAAGRDASVALGWDSPTSNGGAAITSYQYRYKTTGTYPAAWTDATGGSSRSWIVMGLTSGTLHTFQMRAVNIAGAGAASDEVTATPTGTTTTTAPGPPRSLNASGGDGRVTLRWTAPSSDGGARDHQLRVPLQDHRHLPRHLDHRQRRRRGPQRDRFQPGQRHAPHLPGAGGQQRRRRHGVRDDRHADGDDDSAGRAAQSERERRGRPGDAGLDGAVERRGGGDHQVPVPLQDRRRLRGLDRRPRQRRDHHELHRPQPDQRGSPYLPGAGIQQRRRRHRVQR